MNTNDLVVAIDAEISRLQQAKALLSGTDAIIKRKPGRPAGSTTSLKTSPAAPKRIAASSKPARTMTPEARARISAAQKKRWANSRKVEKK